MNARFIIQLLFLLLPCIPVSAQQQIIVAKDGTGNFTTIQAAVNSLTDSAATDRTIFIKNGTYEEQVYVGKHHVVLIGENREKTIITGAIAAVRFACEHPTDKYSGTVNLDGDDITLSTLTIENTYGASGPDSTIVDCINRITKLPEKINLKKSAHQFALRSFKSTRLKVINCTIRSWGADTVSPWNDESGQYYFKDCIMQGGTDFYCPRGWAYAVNCDFICLPGAAAIWHDGSKGKTMKSVLENCRFTGPSPYLLGRYHHEANFYLLNCSFDKNLRDQSIFKAATAKPMFWDSQAYYYNCHKEGATFDWLKNNLATAPGAPSAASITAKWTFEGKWDPEKNN